MDSLHSNTSPHPVTTIRGNWWEPAINEEIDRAYSNGAVAVVLVGPDIKPADSAVENLIIAHRASPEAVLSGSIRNQHTPRLRLNAGYWWSDDELAWRQYSILVPVETREGPSTAPCDWITPSAILIPAKTWRAIGPLDFRFGPFLADLDWSLRAKHANVARLRVGNALFYIPDAPPLTAGNETGEFANILYIARKHGAPHGVWKLAGKRVFSEISQEWLRVGFWTDYGYPVGFVKRIVWFLRNSVQALFRKRLLDTMRQTVSAVFAVYASKSTGAS